MRVLLIGASGKVGRPVLRELLARGHVATAFVRDPAVLVAEFGDVTAVAGDVFEPDQVRAAMADRDVVVSAVALRDDAQRDRTPAVLTATLAAAALRVGVRWISVGGAGSLRTDAGVDFVDTPDFPDVAAGESRGFRAALHELRDRAPDGLDWTVVSPPALIVPDGPRTGAYRSAADTLVVDAAGRSTISAADLAVAIVDEAERASHPRSRFAVGY